MSIHAIAAVFQLDLAPIQKWILTCLADNADNFGGNIFPTITTLSQKSSIPERTLQRHLKELVESGVLEVVRLAQRPTKDKRGRGTEYRLSFMTNPMASAPRPNYQSCPPKLRVEVIDAYQQTCAYCGRKGDTNDPDGRSWHVDRIIPGSRGGSYSPENIALSCATCNVRKGANLAPIPAVDLGAKRMEMGAKEFDTGAKDASTGATATAPDPSVEPSNDPPKEPYAIVFDFYKAHLDHERAILTDERRKLITRRLRDGYSADDLCTAIRGCKLSAFHQGENDRATVYDSIELIFKDAQHVESFIGRANGRIGNGNGHKPRTASERNVANIRECLDIIRASGGESDLAQPERDVTPGAIARRV